MGISQYVKEQRKKVPLSQEELAEKAGVGLRFVRDVERGKQSLCMRKVNQVLALFGKVLVPKPVNNSME